MLSEIVNVSFHSMDHYRIVTEASCLLASNPLVRERSLVCCRQRKKSEGRNEKSFICLYGQHLPFAGG